MNSLPELFVQRLQEIIPRDQYPFCLESFSLPNPLVVRVNTLKISKEELLKSLENLKIIDVTDEIAELAGRLRARYWTKLEKNLLILTAYTLQLQLSIMQKNLLLETKISRASKTFQ